MKFPVLAAVAALLLVPSTLSLAADTKTVIEYRQGHLSAMGGHINALKNIVFGGIAADRQALHVESLATLVNILNYDLETLFPEGSGDGKTKARDTIWSDWDGFKAAAENAATKADALVAAEDDAALAAAFKELGEACKNCHDDYRAK